VASGYLTDMLVVRADGFIDPCIPLRTPKPPSAPTAKTTNDPDRSDARSRHQTGTGPESRGSSGPALHRDAAAIVKADRERI
jgi:hypothetical protein